MKNETVILTCSSIIFYSQQDENTFFSWIKKMECISHASQVKKNILLYIWANDIHDYDLRNLLALFNRYKIRNMKQLSIFLNDENRKWFFENKKAYWYKRVFGAR